MEAGLHVQEHVGVVEGVHFLGALAASDDALGLDLHGCELGLGGHGEGVVCGSGGVEAEGPVYVDLFAQSLEQFLLEHLPTDIQFGYHQLRRPTNTLSYRGSSLGNRRICFMTMPWYCVHFLMCDRKVASLRYYLQSGHRISCSAIMIDKLFLHYW